MGGRASSSWSPIRPLPSSRPAVGYYEDEATGTIDSLLFGLYGEDGLLHRVGHSRLDYTLNRDVDLSTPLPAEEPHNSKKADHRNERLCRVVP
jgi:hypothetical protein